MFYHMTGSGISTHVSCFAHANIIPCGPGVGRG